MHELGLLLTWLRGFLWEPFLAGDCCIDLRIILHC